MNAEKLKKDITRSIELAQSIHDAMVEEFTGDNIPAEVETKALQITGRLATLVWYLEHISEGIAA